MATRDLVDYLELTCEREGSDLHLSVGAPPMARVHGSLSPLEDFDLDRETCQNLILDILTEEGADPNRVIFSHQDFTAEHIEYHDSLAKRGAYVEFDTFGCEAVAKIDEDVWFPSDGERINMVKRQIEMGNVERILISGDLCFKFCFKKWPHGFNYQWIMGCGAVII